MSARISENESAKSGSVGTNTRFSFHRALKDILGSFFRLAHRVHNFSHYSFGQDYILEPAYGESGFLMTSQGDDIKPGDLVILSNGSACTQYQVKEIEYYFDSCDIWTALLNPVNS